MKTILAVDDEPLRLELVVALMAREQLASQYTSIARWGDRDGTLLRHLLPIQGTQGEAGRHS